MDTDLSPGDERGNLARYLDGELPPDERDRLSRALASDPALAASLGRMQEASAAVAALFSEERHLTLPPAPDFRAPSRRRRQRLAAAAVVTLLAAGIVGASPAGASLVQGLRAVAAWITGNQETAPTAGRDGAFAPGSVTVTAPASGATFRVRLDEALPPGRLVVEGHDTDERIRAQAGPAVELVFSRGELVVRADGVGGEPPGTGQPSVLLRLRVPREVAGIRVVRPDGAVEELVVQEGRASVLEWEPVSP